jgi:hypothetical protein
MPLRNKYKIQESFEDVKKVIKEKGQSVNHWSTKTLHINPKIERHKLH